MSRMSSFVLCCGVTLFVGALFEVRADASMVTQAAIDAQPLDGALTSFSRQSGLQVIYASKLVAGQRSSGAPAGLAPEEALQRILANTGLTYSWINERTVAVKGEREAEKNSGVSREGTPPASALSRLAQGETLPRETTENGNPQGPSAASEAGQPDVAEVVVTGTHIRGAAPVGSPLIVIDREDIQKSGRGRLQDFLETLPQNFSGSAGEEVSQFGDAGTVNLTRGQAIDLRGIGASGTLVLIDGRRQANGGLEGAYVDISSIPTAAIERIEILTDGASAIYGSDAVGGVVNFILRKDYEGLETSVRAASIDEAADELQVSLLGGKKWGGGNVLLGYQYSQHDALMAADRPYAALNRDYRSVGGGDLRSQVGFGSPGTIKRAGQPDYAIPAGQNGTQLTVAQLMPGRVNYQDFVTGLITLPEQTLHGAFATFSQELGERFELFASSRYSRREMRQNAANVTALVSVPSTNPFYVNPYGGTGNVQVAYDFSGILGLKQQSSRTDTYTVDIGGLVKLGGAWQLNTTASYAREKNDWQNLSADVDFVRRNACVSGLPASGCPGAPLNLFGDGSANDPATADYIRVDNFQRGTYVTDSLMAIADGPLFELPAGAAKLAVGADYREEGLDGTGGSVSGATGAVTTSLSSVGDLDRQVWAAFAELTLPILANADGVPRLQVSLAGRYEEYSDFGSTFNPKIGVTFVPVDALFLRGSWGTAFRAPRFNEISPFRNRPEAFAVNGYPDPTAAGGTTTIVGIMGADPSLGPETADVWTAGFDLKLTQLPGLSVSTTYFDLDYTDKIRQPSPPFGILQAEDQWGPIVTRNPSQAQINTICDPQNNYGFTGSCPVAANTRAIIDLRLRNLSSLRVRGIDLDLGYRTGLGAGELRFGLAGAYTLTYDLAVTASAAPADLLDTVGNPPALRLRGTAGWSFKGWSAQAAVNYLGDYHVSTLDRTGVDAWTTIDAGVGYSIENGGWLEDTAFQLSVVNLFDEEPPFVNTLGGFDPANGSEIGRSLSISATKRW